MNNSDSETDEESFSLSQTFSGSGSDLLSCHKVNKYTFAAQKRKIFSEMRDNSKEEGLRATIDEGIHDHAFINCYYIHHCNNRARRNGTNKDSEGKASSRFGTESSSEQ